MWRLLGALDRSNARAPISRTATLRRFYIHELKLAGGSYKIEMKRVDLINCEGPHETMQAFF